MSKKNKKKLRKILRAQMERASRESERGGTALKNQDMNVSVQDIDSGSKAGMTEKTTTDTIPKEIDENKHEVTSEIKKILITMGVMVLAIVAIYFINIKTDLILKTGEWMISKLNLSI